MGRFSCLRGGADQRSGKEIVVKGRKIKTQADVDRYIKQGLGQGVMKDYQPWLRVQDVPSHGRSRKVNGMTVDREYHLLSDLEHGLFLQLDFSENVIDIREQFPLLPVAATEGIASSLNIPYPRYPKTSVPYVMTTDFLITVRNSDGSTTDFARTVKPYNHVGTSSEELIGTLNKFEIEKRYWESQGVDWKIITDKNLPPIIAKNLDWLSKNTDVERSLLEHNVLTSFLTELLRYSNSNLTLEMVLRRTGSRLHIGYSDCIRLFRYSVWNKYVRINILQPIQITLPIPQFDITYPVLPSAQEREVV